uniref:GAT domain-containing protein n=1 Tax=Macrostomum lignano TaxID=282301 RepID=A0A1I8HY45_9PLAT
MSTETSGDAALAAQLAQMEMGGTAVAGQGSQQQPPAQQQQQQPPPAQQQQQQPPPAQQQQQQHNGLAPEHLTKLRADVNVFAEMLAEQEDPAVTPEADAQLLRELAGTNQQMQARMLELIGYLGAVIGGPSGGGSGSGSGGSDSPGQLLEDLLRLNDQLNDSLRRFDRLRRAWQDLASGGSFNP